MTELQGQWRHEWTEGLARIETILMVEFLASPDVRPAVEDSEWLMNAPVGPSVEGRALVLSAVDEYGVENVTTGTAQPPSTALVGIYVRR